MLSSYKSDSDCIWNFFAASSDYSDNKSGGESDYNGNGGNDSEDRSFDRYAGRRCDDTTLTVSLSDKVVKLYHEIITKGQIKDKKAQRRPENPDSSFSSITTRRGSLLKVSALLCLCVIWRVNKELNFEGNAGEKSRMTYPAKAPPRLRNFVPSNNRNEADW